MATKTKEELLERIESATPEEQAFCVFIHPDDDLSDTPLERPAGTCGLDGEACESCQ